MVSRLTGNISGHISSQTSGYSSGHIALCWSVRDISVANEEEKERLSNRETPIGGNMRKYLYSLLSVALAGATAATLTTTAPASATTTRTMRPASPATSTEAEPCTSANQTWVHLYTGTDPYEESICVGFAGNYSPNTVYTGFCGGTNTGYIIVYPVLDLEGALGPQIKINYGPGTSIYKFNNTSVFPLEEGYVTGVNIQKWSGSDQCVGSS
jgi:hypothetical protein